ncbi:hypothetical protein [Pelagicoccus sp. SDUM812005]|uniref:hypothetical protein n=1 Tax=Pelagicoccus sp. SDUM812005 TaxID=3041257 RepID=UPI00280DB249|nr:hypothetical protein [Pelagicoccus sp. SDUM812005]MDQ8180907.1 hypothetical protein [Pelagicoccus sp. SDUM812005]
MGGEPVENELLADLVDLVDGVGGGVGGYGGELVGGRSLLGVEGVADGGAKLAEQVAEGFELGANLEKGVECVCGYSLAAGR